MTGDDKEDKKKGGDCEYIVMIKGAPEIVLKKCSTIAVGDKTEKIDKSVQEDFQVSRHNNPNSQLWNCMDDNRALLKDAHAIGNWEK